MAISRRDVRILPGREVTIELKTIKMSSRHGKVAVVHDWLTGLRGGEKVLEAILELFPAADLFTLLYNPGTLSPLIEERRIFTSFIDRLPFKARRYRHYLPLFPLAIEQFDFHGYDLVISSSHCVARGVIVPPGTPHVSFIHSPMRYVWDMYPEYFPRRGLAGRFIIPAFAHYLRMWDVTVAPRVDRYVCNSAFVAERVRRYYGREAGVVFPPSIDHQTKVPAAGRREDFYLIVSAFAPYKRVDLACEAFRDWDGRRLVIVGGGQDEQKLKRYAGPNVEFRGHVGPDEIRDLYTRARGLLFPGLEDFGIVPVEAQACGCPVIAFGKGGALETVVAGRTGVFFEEQTVAALRAAVLIHEKIRYRREDFQKNVRKFSDRAFREGFAREVEACRKQAAAGPRPGGRTRRS